MRHRVTISLKEKVYKKLESARKQKKLSAYFNDFFEEHFGLEKEKNYKHG